MYQSSAQGWSVNVFGAFLHVCFQVAMDVHGIGSARKVNLQQHIFVTVHSAEKVDRSSRFACSTFTDQQHLNIYTVSK